MSVKPTQVTDRVFEYLQQNSSAEDEFLRNLRKEAHEAGIPAINISEDQAKFIQLFIKATRSCNIIELGTLAGYSAITMGRAVPHCGKITTVEVNGKHAKFAEQKVKEAGLSGIINVVNEHGIEYLKSLPDEKQFDFAFIDADKKNYKEYLDLITPKLKVGGIFAADNAFAFGYIMDDDPDRGRRDDVDFIRDFNEYFFSKKEYFTSLLSVGDGLLIGYKISD